MSFRSFSFLRDLWGFSSSLLSPSAHLPRFGHHKSFFYLLLHSWFIKKSSSSRRFFFWKKKLGSTFTNHDSGLVQVKEARTRYLRDNIAKTTIIYLEGKSRAKYYYSHVPNRRHGSKKLTRVIKSINFCTRVTGVGSQSQHRGNI